MAAFSAYPLAPAQRQALGFALRFSPLRFLTLAPYEELLLAAFERGELSLDQVLVHVEAQEFAATRPLPPCYA